jgi:DNA repair exonuclease SbcCD ATPase subunit
VNKLELTKIEFKNFLSYGNQWTTVNIVDGITIIQGEDTNRDKSNGSGKSTIAESVSFALFGQTIKSIKKADIPNWYNLRECEVRLTIKSGTDEFLFTRGLKPNKFTVRKNGSEIPQLSNVKIFQAEIEETIIGMDFKTFKNLIYFSPNNTISILSAGKEEKRKFIESLFDLGIFSDLNKKVNEKLGTNKASIIDIEKDAANNQILIDSYQNDIDTATIPDIKEYQKTLKNKEFKLEALDGKIVNFDEALYQEKKADISQFEIDRTDTLVKITSTQGKIDALKLLVSPNAIEKLRNQHNEIDEFLNTHSKEKVEELVHDRDHDIEYTEKHLKELKEELIVLIDKKHTLEKDKVKLETTIEGLNANALNVEKSNKVEGLSECPTCRQKVDHELVEQKIQEEFDVIREDISGFVTEGVTVDGKIDGVKEETDKLKEIIIGVKDQYTKMGQERSDLLDDLMKISSIEKDKKALPDLLTEEKEYQKNNLSLSTLEEDLGELKWKSERIDDDITLTKTGLVELEEHKELYITHCDLKKDLMGDIRAIKEQIKEFTILIDKQNVQLEEKRSKISELEDVNLGFIKKVRGLNKLSDHLMYIKKGLSDDNIKQYAIGSILPYLNSMANYYLNESNIPYTISIDGWLDVKIKGLGVGDISFGSLSGGETKAVEMAVSLACNDIAELQGASMLNIQIFDEILDSSLDSGGVQDLMNIIKVRQQMNGSCVYIITHRTELQGIEYDNILKINKTDGFSSIEG